MKIKIRPGLWALALTAVLLTATGAWAWSDETRVLSKSMGSSSLLLEDDITVLVDDSTEIRDVNGVRMQFADLPDPLDAAPGIVVLRVEGSLSGKTVQATKITMRPLIRQ